MLAATKVNNLIQALSNQHLLEQENNCGAKLIEVGNDRRLADPEALNVMLEAYKFYR
tara:strand:+ start:223 stop:393 length:171 start_codon:yes stop_codon:yes gene_type:complete